MSVEKFKKHINKPVKIMLNDQEGNDDEFEFQPLNVKQFSTMMILGDRISKTTNSDGTQKDGAMMNIEDTKDMMDLYVDVVMTSYPELEKSIAEQFVVANFADFSDIMVKLSPEKIDPRKADLMKKMQQKAIDAKKAVEAQTPNA